MATCDGGASAPASRLVSSLAPPDCPPEKMNAEDFLFILYTSGSTGKPKGVVHSTAGFFFWDGLKRKYRFVLHVDDIFFIKTDNGLVSGPNYVTYGQLCNN